MPKEICRHLDIQTDEQTRHHKCKVGPWTSGSITSLSLLAGVCLFFLCCLRQVIGWPEPKIPSGRRRKEKRSYFLSVSTHADLEWTEVSGKFNYFCSLSSPPLLFSDVLVGALVHNLCITFCAFKTIACDGVDKLNKALENPCLWIHIELSSSHCEIRPQNLLKAWWIHIYSPVCESFKLRKKHVFSLKSVKDMLLSQFQWLLDRCGDEFTILNMSKRLILCLMSSSGAYILMLSTLNEYKNEKSLNNGSRSLQVLVTIVCLRNGNIAEASEAKIYSIFHLLKVSEQFIPLKFSKWPTYVANG